MNLIHIFKDSLDLLLKRPRIFIPKLVSTGAYTLYILLIAKFTRDISDSMLRVGTMLPSEGTVLPGGDMLPWGDRVWEGDVLLNDTLFPGDMLLPPELIHHILLFVLILVPFILLLTALDLITYAMYPRIVDDYNRGRKISLIGALKDALGVWKILLSIGILLMILMVFVFAITVIFTIIALFADNMLLLLPSILIALILVILFAIFLFFVVPVAVMEKKGVMGSFRDSFSLGMKHKGKLFYINLIFLVLSAVTLGIAMLIDEGDLITYSAILLFILSRIFQAIVYTYISVVNPYFYMQVQSQQKLQS